MIEYVSSISVRLEKVSKPEARDAGPNFLVGDFSLEISESKPPGVVEGVDAILIHGLRLVTTIILAMQMKPVQ
jgi:hypothetical protein